MNTLRKGLIASALAVLSIVSSSSPAGAAPIVLDTFSGAVSSWNPATPPGVLQANGTRTLTLGIPGLQNGGDFVSVGGGTFSHQSNTTSNFTTQLAYSFGPADLSTGQGLHINFDSIDAGSSVTNRLSALIEILTSTGTLSATIFFPEGNFAQDFLVPYVALSGPGNLNSAIGARITFNNIGDAGVDFILSGDRPLLLNGEVPEPTTIATFGLIGLLGGAAVRRRLKKTA